MVQKELKRLSLGIKPFKGLFIKNPRLPAKDTVPARKQKPMTSQESDSKATEIAKHHTPQADRDNTGTSRGSLPAQESSDKPARDVCDAKMPGRPASDGGKDAERAEQPEIPLSQMEDTVFCRVTDPHTLAREQSIPGSLFGYQAGSSPVQVIELTDEYIPDGDEDAERAEQPEIPMSRTEDTALFSPVQATKLGDGQIPDDDRGKPDPEKPAPGLRLNMILDEEKLVCQNDDTRVYLISDPAVVEQLRSFSGINPEPFSKTRIWNLAEEMEKQKNDQVLKEIAARLSVIEEKLRELESLRNSEGPAEQGQAVQQAPASGRPGSGDNHQETERAQAAGQGTASSPPDTAAAPKPSAPYKPTIVLTLTPSLKGTRQNQGFTGLKSTRTTTFP